MTDTPKFTVVDRRKFRAEEESSSPAESNSVAPVATAESDLPAAPRLTLVDKPSSREPEPVPEPAPGSEPIQPIPDEDTEMPDTPEGDRGADPLEPELPPAPSTEETRFQKLAYDQAAERLENLVRAQNPAAPPSEQIGFEHLVQQLYLSAMMQMGAGTPEGQRPRIDILGARQTIDLLEVVLDKSQSNLNAHELRTLNTVLYELRATFLELTRMISAQPQPPMPPPPGAPRR